MRCGIFIQLTKQEMDYYRSTSRTIAWVIGNRDTKTFEKLYNKIMHYQS